MRKVKECDKLKRINILLPPKLMHDIKKRCNKIRMSFSLYVRQIIMEHEENDPVGKLIEISKYIQHGDYAPKEYDPGEMIECYYKIGEIINRYEENK